MLFRSVKDFDQLPLTDEKKPRVGIVGEILVKFLPSANNYLVELLEAEGAEAVCPDLTDFLLYCSYDSKFRADFLGKKRTSAWTNQLVIQFIEWYRKPAKRALNASERFTSPDPIQHLEALAKPFVSPGNQTGEGWFLTGEMVATCIYACDS